MRHQYHHCDRHRPDDPRRVAAWSSRDAERARAGAAGRRLDALLLRRRRMRRRRRSVSTTRCSARVASGTRAGRRSAVHGPLSGIGNYDHDQWELFHLEQDRAEAQEPRRGATGEAAGARRALVRGGRASTTCSPSTTACRPRSSTIRRPQPEEPRDTLRLLPGHRGVPEVVAVHARSLLQDPRRRRAHEPGLREGVIFAHGSRFGGHALFLKDQKLWYVYNFLGLPPEQQFVSDRARARQARARHGVREGVDR